MRGASTLTRKTRIFVGQIHSIFLANCRDILVVLLCQFVAAVEFNHPLRGDAANRTTTDRANARQRLRRICEAILRRTINTVAIFVERDHMNVDFPTTVIC